MKKALLFLGAIVLLSCVIIKANVNASPANDITYKAGCCSRHGGVCGCDKETKRAICCDKTLSPSCGCN